MRPVGIAARGLVAVAGLAAAFAAPPAMAASVSIDDNPCSPTPSGDEYCFNPPSQSAASGETVTWTNNSGASHTITRCTVAACGVSGGTGTDSWNGTGTNTVPPGGYSHAFTGAGTYVYYCVIHGYAAMHGTITVTAAGGEPPTASFTAPASATTGQIVTFDATGSHANPDTESLKSYVWNFGDGTPAVTTSSATTTHVFATASTFSVTLEVISKEGASATETQPITITGGRVDTAPVASFTFSPTSPQTGQAVTFDASATVDPDGDAVTTYAWNFGDGATAGTGTATETHTYASTGTFTVTLVATDANGKQSTAVSHHVTVVAPPGEPPSGGGPPPGSGPPGGAGPPPGGSKAAHVSKLKLAAKRLCRHKRARCRTTRSKLTFTLSAAASVTLVIEHRGKPVHRTRLRGKAGAHSTQISATGLKPGRYVLVVTPAGGKSVTLKFAVVSA